MPEEEIKRIQDYLDDQSLKDFVYNNLLQSLQSIGFSSKFVSDLFTLLDCLSEEHICLFQKKYEKDLDETYSTNFFKKIVPSYFSKYVTPEIPQCRTVVDVGCSTGIFAYSLSKERRVEKVIGIDIIEYPEWSSFKNKKLRFEVVSENFFEFLNETKPDVVTMTWTLHHISYQEQLHYLKGIFEILKPCTHFVVLEDTYSTVLDPELGTELYSKFFSWGKEDRVKIMSVYDWIANRILARRKTVPIPFGYRTMEEWVKTFEKIGFLIEKETFIGFPEQRDINTPQGLIKCKKD